VCTLCDLESSNLGMSIRCEINSNQAKLKAGT